MKFGGWGLPVLRTFLLTQIMRRLQTKYIFWVRVYPRATLTTPSFGASATLIFTQTDLNARKSTCDF
jgi:hypothetical protein